MTQSVAEIIDMYEERCAHLEAELLRIKASLLAHCPDCCSLRWHLGQGCVPPQ